MYLDARKALKAVQMAFTPEQCQQEPSLLLGPAWCLTFKKNYQKKKKGLIRFEVTQLEI